MAGDRTAPHDGHNPLLRVLGVGFGVAIGVGGAIGGGILRTPGLVADRVPDGFLITLLWLAGGLHALIGANVIAEVMTALPRSGGLYIAARRAFGDTGGLLVGWSDWLFNTAVCASLAIVGSEYIGLIVPALAAHKIMTGVLLLALAFGLNWFGVREGSAAQKIASLLKCLLLLGLIGAIFLLLPPVAQTPAPAAPAAGFGASLIAFVVAYQFVFGAYSGWQNAAYFSEENAHPGRSIPRALGLSIITVMVVYGLMSAALVWALPMAELRTAELPLALPLASVLGEATRPAIAATAVVIVLSCLIGAMMMVPRILYGLSRDGLFPAFATGVNKGGTPHVALLITSAVALGLTLTGSYEKVFLIGGAFGILIFVMTDIAFFVMRRREPDLERPFRAVGYPWLPLLVLAVDSFLLVTFLVADPLSAVFVIGAAALAVPIGLWLSARRPKELAAPSV